MFGGPLKILVCQCTAHCEKDFAINIKTDEEPTSFTLVGNSADSSSRHHLKKQQLLCWGQAERSTPRRSRAIDYHAFLGRQRDEPPVVPVYSKQRKSLTLYPLGLILERIMRVIR
jgi:hypothetical protein